MVGVMVMGILFVGLYLGFTQGFAIIQVARENLRGAQILQEKTETTRLLDWSRVANGSCTFSNYFYPLAATNASKGILFSGTRTISDAPLSESYSSDVKLVSLQLTWTSGKVQRQRTMTTLVSQYGLHNYIVSYPK